jgi:superfamily II DNA/RNA helicase
MELTANHNINQIVEVCTEFEKRNKLIKHLDQISSENAKVLIFVATKRVADDITKYLRQDGWPALAIHGDKEQCVPFAQKVDDVSNDAFSGVSVTGFLVNLKLAVLPF